MRHTSLIAAAALTAAIGMSACSSDTPDKKLTGDGTTATPSSTPPSKQTSSSTSYAPAPSTKAPLAAADVPTRISINSIGVNKPLVSLGLKNGKIDPSQGVVQWYNAYPSPGKAGNAIIAAHVTYNGTPDAFVDLHKVKLGDTVKIAYNGAAEKTFKITKKEAVDKTTLRKRQDVWGDSSTPHLVLITCDADSKLVGQHHVDNYVVWADPVS